MPRYAAFSPRGRSWPVGYTMITRADAELTIDVPAGPSGEHAAEHADTFVLEYSEARALPPASTPTTTTTPALPHAGSLFAPSLSRPSSACAGDVARAQADERHADRDGRRRGRAGGRAAPDLEHARARLDHALRPAAADGGRVRPASAELAQPWPRAPSLRRGE